MGKNCLKWSMSTSFCSSLSSSSSNSSSLSLSESSKSSSCEIPSSGKKKPWFGKSSSSEIVSSSSKTSLNVGIWIFLDFWRLLSQDIVALDCRPIVFSEEDGSFALFFKLFVAGRPPPVGHVFYYISGKMYKTEISFFFSLIANHILRTFGISFNDIQSFLFLIYESFEPEIWGKKTIELKDNILSNIFKTLLVFYRDPLASGLYFTEAQWNKVDWVLTAGNSLPLPRSHPQNM